jgi:hypothetical protein
VVAALPDSSWKDRAQLLGHEIEELVVEAKRLGIELAEVLSSISAHWTNLSGDDNALRVGKPAVNPPAVNPMEPAVHRMDKESKEL